MLCADNLARPEKPSLVEASPCTMCGGLGSEPYACTDVHVMRYALAKQLADGSRAAQHEKRGRVESKSLDCRGSETAHFRIARSSVAAPRFHPSHPGMTLVMIDVLCISGG